MSFSNSGKDGPNRKMIPANSSFSTFLCKKIWRATKQTEISDLGSAGQKTTLNDLLV